MDATDLPATHAVPRGARSALTLLLLINLLNYIDRQILSSVEEPIGHEFGKSAAATGSLATAFLVSYMLFSPVFGFLADRVRRWAIIGIGVLIWTAASGGSGAVPTFALLVAMRIMIGIGEAAYGPVAPTIISDLYPVERRGHVLSFFYAAIPVGSAMGYIIGGLFPAAHWHWAFYATVPPGILLGVWCFWMREPPRSAPGEKPARRATWDDYLSLFRIKSFVYDTIGMTLMTFAYGGIGFFMPRYLSSAGLDPAKSKFLLGVILAGTGLVATLAGGIAGDWLKPRMAGSYFLVSGGGMIVGFPLFLLMLFMPFPAAWFVFAAAVFCLFFNTGPTNTILANVTPPGIRATAFAVNILIIHLLGDAVSPVVIGRIADLYNLRVAFEVISISMLLSGIAWILGSRHLARDTAAVSAAGG